MLACCAKECDYRLQSAAILLSIEKLQWGRLLILDTGLQREKKEKELKKEGDGFLSSSGKIFLESNS